MILASYLAGIAILSLLPLLFLAARLLAKRAKRQAWTVDDALLCIALFLLYVVVAMFIVGASSYFISYPFGSNPTNAAAAMAARLVRQRITDATVGQLKRTLIVLWLFRLPMAIGQALTRCAIAIFFIQTLYTKVFPWLRHFGTSV